MLTKNLEEFKENLRKLSSEDIVCPAASTKELELEIEELQASLTPYSDEKTESRKEILLARKEELQAEHAKAQRQLISLDNNKKAQTRISELEREEHEIAVLIADLEGAEFLLEEFSRDKINYTEEKINSMFKLAKFKMFHYQVNGGVAETCETTYLGVPYSDLNTASRINVGLDIINALTGFYGVTAPIFIDNRESVTEIIETDSQVISLVVNENDKELRVE